jgi:hypothetical protein
VTSQDGVALTFQMKMPPEKGVLIFNYMNYWNLRVKGGVGVEIPNANGTPTGPGFAHATAKWRVGGVKREKPVLQRGKPLLAARREDPFRQERV